MEAVKKHIDPDTEKQKIWSLLGTISDPEIPVLTIHDLGIVRDVQLNIQSVDDSVQGKVIITPTYSGCPAMDMIATNIRLVLAENGYGHLKIETALAPAWTTDWMSEEGKIKLSEYGIAAPVNRLMNGSAMPENIQCPLCNSTNTRLISEFGSTACKALYQCNDCSEPFDYLKCH